jgi:molybdopterin molybdotransferase
VVTLPGNPVSAAISFEIFVRPALLAAAGHRVVARPNPRGALATDVTAPPGRRQYRRGHYEPGTGRVAPVGGPGSHLLASLSAANCLFVVPEEAAALSAGTEVEIIDLGALAG